MGLNNGRGRGEFISIIEEQVVTYISTMIYIFLSSSGVIYLLLKGNGREANLDYRGYTGVGDLLEKPCVRIVAPFVSVPSFFASRDHVENPLGCRFTGSRLLNGCH